MNMSRLAVLAIVTSSSLAISCGAFAKEKDDDAADSENEVSIEKTTLVRDAGDKFEPVESFKPTDTFGVLVKLNTAKVGTHVKGVWTIVDAGGMKNKKIFEKDVEMTAAALKEAKEPTRIDFSLSHDNPYPAGDYKMEVYLNGELADTIEFEIK
jgi:hypothetical protein